MCLSDTDLVCDKCREKVDEIFNKLQLEKPKYTTEDETKAREEWHKSLCEDCRKILEEEGFIVKTKIPIEALEELADLLENWYNSLTSGDMPDQHGICEIVARGQSYLENVKKLYWECAGCGRTMAPDEPHQIDKHEDCYCMKCVEEGL